MKSATLRRRACGITRNRRVDQLGLKARRLRFEPLEDRRLLSVDPTPPVYVSVEPAAQRARGSYV